MPICTLRLKEEKRQSHSRIFQSQIGNRQSQMKPEVVMWSTFGRLVVTLISLALVVGGLWLWQHAGLLASDAGRPDVAGWAIRSGAVAAVALAQALLSFFVISAVFDRDLFTSAVRFTAGLVGGAAIVSAVALGFAGR
jgi:hypothetical protein